MGCYHIQRIGAPLIALYVIIKEVTAIICDTLYGMIAHVDGVMNFVKYNTYYTTMRNGIF